MIIAGSSSSRQIRQDRRQHSVSPRFLHQHHSRQAGPENVEVVGNSPDPLELIDKYGATACDSADAHRAYGQDIRFDERQIEEGRNFATKLWNVARFARCTAQAMRTKDRAQALSIYASKCSRA
jgi:isoleucyl-tRNA synthetase